MCFFHHSKSHKYRAFWRGLIDVSSSTLGHRFRSSSVVEMTEWKAGPREEPAPRRHGGRLSRSRGQGYREFSLLLRGF